MTYPSQSYVDAHHNGDCGGTPSTCPLCELEQDQCERCDDPIEERFCTHRDLCPSCLHHCGDCQADFAETAAYESERDG